jgi:hypothetical protein
MPSLDLALRETMRHVVNYTALRSNVTGRDKYKDEGSLRMGKTC